MEATADLAKWAKAQGVYWPEPYLMTVFDIVMALVADKARASPPRPPSQPRSRLAAAPSAAPPPTPPPPRPLTVAAAACLVRRTAKCRSRRSRRARR